MNSQNEAEVEGHDARPSSEDAAGMPEPTDNRSYGGASGLAAHDANRISQFVAGASEQNDNTSSQVDAGVVL